MPDRQDAAPALLLLRPIMTARRRPCMTDAEWAEWNAANDAMTWPKVRSASPCTDCLASFAASMRAVGSCDGEPGIAWGPRGAHSHRAGCGCHVHPKAATA